MTSGRPGKDSCSDDSNDLHAGIISLDAKCNPSWQGMAISGNSTVVEATRTGSVDVTSIVALVIFFALIVYSA